MRVRVVTTGATVNTRDHNFTVTLGSSAPFGKPCPFCKAPPPTPPFYKDCTLEVVVLLVLVVVLLVLVLLGVVVLLVVLLLVVVVVVLMESVNIVHRDPPSPTDVDPQPSALKTSAHRIPSSTDRVPSAMRPAGGTPGASSVVRIRYFLWLSGVRPELKPGSGPGSGPGLENITWCSACRRLSRRSVATTFTFMSTRSVPSRIKHVLLRRQPDVGPVLARCRSSGRRPDVGPLAAGPMPTHRDGWRRLRHGVTCLTPRTHRGAPH
ncbi:hypothetical protein EYF80_053341 [Liparis tanakae]|uniref:Uncharacterized protein n=1 Tax=Liparis tanakae TaxID=230148 RepID=A0A4Z2F5G6_9TELE|nr:hypothetical protein EYF80_053341 [Liparis tanakae]